MAAHQSLPLPKRCLCLFSSSVFFLSFFCLGFGQSSSNLLKLKGTWNSVCQKQEAMDFDRASMFCRWMFGVQPQEAFVGRWFYQSSNLAVAAFFLYDIIK